MPYDKNRTNKKDPFDAIIEPYVEESKIEEQIKKNQDTRQRIYRIGGLMVPEKDLIELGILTLIMLM